MAIKETKDYRTEYHVSVVTVLESCELKSPCGWGWNVHDVIALGANSNGVQLVVLWVRSVTSD